MADIQYLNYGDLQIELLALLNSLANNVQDYVAKQSWSNKRKLKFMSAYSDIMNKGLLGASNTSGQWMVNVGGDIDLNSKDLKDKEMYQEVAYFIQQQMAGLPTKSSLEEQKKKKEEEDKTKLPVFDFNKDFVTHVNNSINGGQPLNIGGARDLWNYLDERDSNGIRGRKKRANKLAELLESYKTKLGDGSKYNFEGSPYSNINDFNTRIDKAIVALRNDSIDDDREALQAIGLNQTDWFNDGSGDPSGKFDANGNPLTYGQLALYNEALAELKEKELTAIAQQNKIKNSGVLDLSSGIHGTDAKIRPQEYAEYIASNLGTGLLGFNAMNRAVLDLMEKAYNKTISSTEKRLLGNFLYYIRANNPNYKKSNISDLEWQELNLHKNLGSTNRAGFVRLPWQTSDGRYTYADDRGNVYFLKPLNLAKLATPTFNRSAAYNNYKNNFLKSKLQLNNEKPVLSQDTDILISDMTSMLGDIVSLGGGYAGAAGGITTLLSDLYGDIRRGKDTWSTLKNLGANIAWGAAGLIPGAKLGKLAKNAARIYATLQSAGILMNDDVQLSWKNLIAGKSISAKDFENFKWTLHAITGGTNAIRGHLTDKHIAELVKTNNKPTIETKSGKKVTLTEELAKLINKVGGRKGQKAAEEAFKKATGEEVKEGTFSFLENPRAWYNPNRYSQRLRNLTSNDERLVLPKTAQSVNTQAVNRLLEIDKAKPIFAPFSKNFWTTPELRKSGNPFNKRFWTEGGPNRGGLTFALTPYKNGNSNSSSNNIEVDENPTRVLYPSKGNSYLGARPVYDSKNYSPNLVKKEYKNIIEKQNYTENKVTEGTYKLMDDDIKVTESSGRFTIKLNNLVIGSNLELKRVKEIISTLVKENKQSANKVTSNAYKLSTKDIGRILLDLKRKGWLKQGGIIDKQKIQKYKEFIKK